LGYAVLYDIKWNQILPKTAIITVVFLIFDIVFINFMSSFFFFLKLIFKQEVDIKSEDKVSNIHDSFLIIECSYSKAGHFQPLNNIIFSILHLNFRSLRKNISSIIQLFANTVVLAIWIGLTDAVLQVS